MNARAAVLEDRPRGRLEDLIALASEPSSTRRRELLREVTDLFFVSLEGRGERERALFDDVLTRLAAEMEVEVKLELSARLAASVRPPPKIVRTLALADIEVARPLLEGGPALGEDDLLHLAAHAPQPHLQLVSARTDVTAAVSDALIRSADDATLEVLVSNPTAELSRSGEESVVDRALANPDLHEAVVGRTSLPLDLLNEMYLVVEAKLRDRIQKRNAEVTPEVLEAALAASRVRLAELHGALPPDHAAAAKAVQAMKAAGTLKPAGLVPMLRSGERTRFLLALSDLAEIDFATLSRIVARPDFDALAIVCRAADFDRALFLTFTVLLSERDEGMGRAADYGRLYNELPQDTASRTLRFWRMRRASGEINPG